MWFNAGGAGTQRRVPEKRDRLCVAGKRGIVLIFSVVTVYAGQPELFSAPALVHRDFFEVPVMVLTFCEVLREQSWLPYFLSC
jgi:hypothetical protein